MTTRMSGIGGDIRPAASRQPRNRGAVPLPPDMPRRRHVVDLNQPSVQARPAAAPAARPKVRLSKMLPVRGWNIAQYPVIAVVALGAAASPTFGQIMVAVYGLGAIITRQSSQLTFGLALILLISVPLFQALGQPGIAQTAAIYVFELLVVGTIQAIIELKQTA